MFGDAQILSAKSLSLSEAIALGQKFAHFDLKLDAAERSALRRLKIEKTAYYNNFADLAALEERATKFILSLGNTADTSAKAARLITRLANETVSAFQSETAWVALRPDLPTDLFDIARWHGDGYYYQPYVGKQYKVAIPLKGARTLFTDLASEAADEITRRVVNTSYDDLEGREEMAKLIAKNGRIETAGKDQGTVFVVGAKELALHSEPPIREPRFFMSVVAGRRDQIMQIYEERWAGPHG